MATTKQRLDVAVHERGLVESRAKARALIMAGEVLVNGEPALHAARSIQSGDAIDLRSKPRFVSRGGEKLAAALARFAIVPDGWTCADFGASTGGFTDCLLQNGAARVYALDVGYGQIDARLRSDPRVSVIDRTNIRYLSELPELVQLVAIDVSFISLDLILPAAARVLAPEGSCVPLVKPQFEAGRGQLGKGGVVRDPSVHRSVLDGFVASAHRHGFALHGLMRSPIVGAAGNVEFLAHLRRGEAPDDPSRLIAAVMAE